MYQVPVKQAHVSQTKEPANFGKAMNPDKPLGNVQYRKTCSHRFYAMMDGSYQHAYFFSIGSYKWVIIGGQEKKGKIPGPTSAQGFELVQLAELYVVMPLNELEGVILKL